MNIYIYIYNNSLNKEIKRSISKTPTSMETNYSYRPDDSHLPPPDQRPQQPDQLLQESPPNVTPMPLRGSHAEPAPWIDEQNFPALFGARPRGLGQDSFYHSIVNVQQRREQASIQMRASKKKEILASKRQQYAQRQMDSTNPFI